MEMQGKKKLEIKSFEDRQQLKSNNNVDNEDMKSSETRSDNLQSYRSAGDASEGGSCNETNLSGGGGGNAAVAVGDCTKTNLSGGAQPEDGGLILVGAAPSAAGGGGGGGGGSDAGLRPIDLNIASKTNVVDDNYKQSKLEFNDDAEGVGGADGDGGGVVVAVDTVDQVPPARKRMKSSDEPPAMHGGGEEVVAKGGDGSASEGGGGGGGGEPPMQQPKYGIRLFGCDI